MGDDVRDLMETPYGETLQPKGWSGSGLGSERGGRGRGCREGHPEDRLEAALQRGHVCQVSLHLKHFQKVATSPFAAQPLPQTRCPVLPHLAASTV